MKKHILCKLFNHKFIHKGEITVVGPGEYLGNGMACWGVPEKVDHFVCKRCGETKDIRKGYEGDE
jgi:Fe2+ or Zn2+ uptake regulation protein